MIKKLVRQMLTAQIFSALTVSLCLLIDSIMIGNFLGQECIAAYGLANPILLVIGAVGTMLSAGVQVTCSKSLGQGSQEETNKGYSSALAVGGGVSILLMLIVLLLRNPLATAMGAGSSGELFNQTSSYMAGFIIGAPGSMGALVLVPFMQMAGQSTLLIAAVLSMTVADVALDLLNVLVFHGGMFGMGLASSLSYYIALVIACVYFLSKKCLFRFSLKAVTRQKMLELLKSGVPAVFNMASSVILIFAMNQLLLRVGGVDAVAAYTVINNIGNASNCITTGIGGVSLTLAGIFFNEEDDTALKQLMRLLTRDSVLLGVCVGAALALLSPLAVGLFLPTESAARSMAILGVRLYALGFVPCCLNNMLKNAWQATGRVFMTEITSLLEGACMPLLMAFIFSSLMGVSGAWLFFGAGEAITLILLCIYIRVRENRMPWQGSACLLLKKDFHVSSENLMEWDIKTLEDVTQAARQAQVFCLTRSGDKLLSERIALCVEEMAANTVQHGFGASPDKRHLSVRLINKPNQFVLRMRDDCRAFDPAHYVPQGDEMPLGIQLVTHMADEIRYTYSLSLNNLTLILGK